MVADILKAKDFYEILSLQRNCTDDDIKKAYRKVGVVWRCTERQGGGVRRIRAVVVAECKTVADCFEACGCGVVWGRLLLLQCA